MKKRDIIGLFIMKIMLSRKQNEDREPIVYRVFGATLGAVVMFLAEVLQIVVIAALIIIPIRLYVVKPFIVKGASMDPSLTDGEYLIIDELGYRIGSPERGHIVVFEPPGNDTQYYIKRVIGLPGETIEIMDGIITISNKEFPNGVILKEDYIQEYTHGREMVILGLNEYYVLGDNRDASLDSRQFGPIKEYSIVGRAWLRGLPIDKLGTLGIPDYEFSE